MKKAKFIIIIVCIMGIVSLLTYLNYDRIVTYFTNREWEIADSIGKIEMEQYLKLIGTNTHLWTIHNTGIESYSDNLKNTYQKMVALKDVMVDSAGDYVIVAEKNAGGIYVMVKNEEVWSNTIDNATILGVTINRNGYSAIIFSQAGYKSLIRVYSNTGAELFTSYLASTYAIDVSISNDNKTLAVAEIDTNGVSLTSGIKLIDMQSASESTVKKFELGEELISDIEYTHNNGLLILTDASAKTLNNGALKNLIEFEKENIILATISNKKNVVVAQLDEEGIFNVKCFINVYDVEHGIKKSYEIDETPNKMIAYEDTIAIDTGNKIIFLNSSADFLKKSEYNGQLKDIALFAKGNMAVLVFRDVAEFIKIGGM